MQMGSIGDMLITPNSSVLEKGTKIMMIAVGGGANKEFDRNIAIVEDPFNGNEFTIRVIEGRRAGTITRCNFDSVNWKYVILENEWDN